jgi:hypothetical protein
LCRIRSPSEKVWSTRYGLKSLTALPAIAFSHDRSRSSAACWAFVIDARVERGPDEEEDADDELRVDAVDGAFSPGARARKL